MAIGSSILIRAAAESRPRISNIYLFALRSLGISPEEAVAVEDSPLGVQAAVAAGIRCIGFTGHNHVGEAIDQELLQAGAFVLEPDMGKVADLILKG